MKLPLTFTLIATLFAADMAIAGSVDVSRQTQLGVMTRHSERVRTETGLRRSTEIVTPQDRSLRREVDISGNAQSRIKQVTVTGADGVSKTREKTVERVADEGMRSRTVSQTGFDGETRTRVDELTRTENGTVATTIRTNAQGDVYKREATRSIDTENNTATKTVTRTNPEGEVRTHTVVRSYSQAQQGPSQQSETQAAQ